MILVVLVHIHISSRGLRYLAFSSFSFLIECECEAETGLLSENSCKHVATDHTARLCNILFVLI